MIKRSFFDESGNYIDDGEPVYLGTKVVGGTPKFGSNTRADMLAKCKDPDSPVSTMLKDRVMYDHIKNKNASDKSLKKDAEALQRNANIKRKKEEKGRIWKKANESRDQYRKKYKRDIL